MSVVCVLLRIRCPFPPLTQTLISVANPVLIICNSWPSRYTDSYESLTLSVQLNVSLFCLSVPLKCVTKCAVTTAFVQCRRFSYVRWLMPAIGLAAVIANCRKARKRGDDPP